jgi:hypothetical protein
MTAFIAIVLIVLLGVALLLLLSAIALYARLVRLRDAVRSSRLAIDVKLKECHELSVNEGPVADADFQRRQTRLRGLEDNIGHSVRSYNALVRDYNTEISAFPSNIVAGLFKFKKDESLYLEE